MDLKELSLVNPETHWYYQAKLKAILQLINDASGRINSIVEVGAGSAFFGKAISEKMGRIPLICVDTNYGENSRQVDHVTYRKSGQDCHADLYLFIDVLEHVKDDSAPLKEYLDVAPSKSIFIITVPAFMSLWSGHDTFLEHVKRYRIQELTQMANQLGVKTLSKGYLFSLIFPIAWVVRKLFTSKKVESSMKPVPKFVNIPLKLLTNCEHRVLNNQFIGLSAFIMFRKE